MSNPTIQGLHHVTCFCSDPLQNHKFYTEVLGLRFVKKTVNFDDPSSYHLYYGDGVGTPGSIMTFFSWPDMPSGREGTGFVSATAFAVPEPAFAYWQERLKKNNVEVRGPMERLGEVYIEFEDRDGLRLEIVIADQSAAFKPWKKSPVPPEMQFRGFHSVTLSESGYERTQALLTHQMGWSMIKEGSGRFRYQAAGGGPASLVDIVCQPGGRHGLPGNGTVHHVAFRVEDDESQRHWRQTLAGYGYNLSPVMDRSYFHSIYYREPGGILFEIATNLPGFSADEAMDSLGTALKLPAQFEASRARIETALPLIPAV